MPDSFRTQIPKLCEHLTTTKRDLIREIYEAVEWLKSEPDRFEIWIEFIRPWILDVIESINECVEAVQGAVKDGSASPLVSLLVMESAANILHTTPAWPAIYDRSPDEVREEENEDEERKSGGTPGSSSGNS